MSRRKRDTVPIVMNRENAGVVSKSFFDQNIQRPERPGRYGVARRPVSNDCGATRILDDPLGATRILAEGRLRKIVNKAMRISMGRDFVAGVSNAAHQIAV